MTTIQVAILFGGRSVEHDISIISAQNIANYIDKTRYHVYYIGICKQGNWYLCNQVTKNITSGQPLQINLQATQPVFLAGSTNFSVEVVFPVLHGTDGEDGSIQGLLKTMGIAFVGSETLGSAVAMDKLITKHVLQNSAIPVAKFMSYRKAQANKIDYDTLVARLGTPFIIKPANLGSSVGVYKISEPKGFKEKVNSLFSFDNTMLAEEFIEGRELECAVLGNTNPVASPAGEIVLKGGYEFYSFEAKYVDKNAVDIVIPADIPKETHERIKTLSIRAYQATACKDLARIDIFLKTNGEVIVNEINTIPGFTDISMYPKLMEQLGISYSTLITRLLTMALERHQEAQRISTNFESNL